MSSRPELKIDWATHEAAKYAVLHWHYSKAMPAGKNIYIGAWEDGKFIGCVIFGAGSGNSTNGSSYGLNRSHEMAELVRVALTKHKTPVSRIVSVALKFLKKQSPKIRLVISMADPEHGHTGGIYQAGNWIYSGQTKPDVQYFSHGKWVHHRTATSRGSAKGLPSRKLLPKYRYLMPLDDEMRKQIEPLRKPYPKRDKQAIGNDQLHSGGAAPTVTLQNNNEVPNAENP